MLLKIFHLFELCKVCRSIKEGRVQDDKYDRRDSTSWRRRINFSSFTGSCQDDEEENDSSPSSTPSPLVSVLRSISQTAGSYTPEEALTCEEGMLQRKVKCVMAAAKNGLKEGVLSGIFFGGGWGIYRYISLFYLYPEDYEKGLLSGITTRASRNNNRGNSVTDCFVNKNIIFVSACNSAILFGVIGTLICGTRASLTYS